MASNSNYAFSEDFADFIIPYNTVFPNNLNNDSVFTDSVDSQFSVSYIPLEQVTPLTLERFSYHTIPSLYTLMDTSSMEAAGITSTFSQPYLNVRGEGTMIGFIDTGIDYTNPLFQLPDGSSRILGIWDQTLIAEEPSDETNQENSMSYGRQFNQIQINQALSSPNPLEVVPSTDESGHGTFMAGIAAGSQSISKDFTGAAPSCNIGVVKLKPAKQYLRNFYQIQDSAIAYQENDIMMGIRYLEQLSIQNEMPLVIYIGLGTNYGSHEGTSPLCLVLRRINSLTGFTSVLPAGNESSLRHHFLGNLSPTSEYEDVEIRVSPGENGFVMELWATPPELFTVGFISPIGETVQRVPLSLNHEINLSFALEPTKITVSYGISNYGSGSEYIFIRFTAPTAGIWRLRVYNNLHVSGRYHIWLPVQGFISDDTIFLNPDPDTTITEPANTFNAITSAAYNHVNKSIYIHSSRGDTRNSMVKPDLTAPGVNVYGPGLSVPGSDQNYPMTRKSGTSVAAAHLAGAAANLLTWGIIRKNQEDMSSAAIKAFLIRGASRENAYVYPNKVWGFGTLNLSQTFLSIRE